MTNSIESIISNIDKETLETTFQNWTQGVYADNLAGLANDLGVTKKEAELIGQNWHDNN